MKSPLFCICSVVGFLLRSVDAAEKPVENFPGFEWQNPIHFDEAAGIYGDRLRDPHIIRVGDSYYLTHTMTPCSGPEEYDPYKRREGSGPGVRLYSTKDFKTWKAETWIVNTDELPADCPYRNQCWAPEINAIGGKFYAVFYAGNWKLGQHTDCYLGVADKVTGPYEHITNLKGAGCDVTLAEDDAGKVYAFMIGNGIRVQQVDLSGIERGDIKLVGPVKTAVETSYADKGLWIDRWTEGPWVKRHGKKYCLFYAVHLDAKADRPRNQYWMEVSYADHPMGPWTQDERPGVFWGGHGSVFDGPDGRWWYCYKNEKFNAVGEDFLCIDPLDFLPDARIASGEPTPYNILSRIAPEGTVTRTTAVPKPVPPDRRLRPLLSPTLLPAIKCGYPARKLADWDFQKAADGTPLSEGFIREGVLSLANAAGPAFEARALARPSGPKLVKEGDRLALDTSGGCVLFPARPGKPELNANMNFSVWMRVKPLKSPTKQKQGFATTVGRWHMSRSMDGRLELRFGPHLGNILHGSGPQLENGRWYDIGFSFEGDADPSDLHQDIVTVYVDGKVVGTAMGRGMFNSRDSFQIGCDWYDGNNKFEGLIQHAIFWDGVVTESDMAALSGKPEL
jgi:xylan 1,4-beta-xylosidase